MITLLVMSAICAEGWADEAQPPMFADAEQYPLLKEIDRRAAVLIRRAEKPEDPKSAYSQARRLELSVVEAYLNSRECDMAIVLNEFGRDPFPSAYLGLRNSFIHGLMRKRDIDGLTRLLAVNCPENRMGQGEAIESSLALNPAEVTRGRGTLVLCDAWEMSKSKANQKRLITALRRGFEPVGITAKDDAAYVTQVRKWLAENNETFEPNPDYRLKAGGPYSFRNDIPLFVPKGSVEKWDGRTNYPPTAKE